MVVQQPASGRPFIKDFQWYKQTFFNKHREIKELLKRFARIEEQCSSSAVNAKNSGGDLENSGAGSAISRFNQLSDEI